MGLGPQYRREFDYPLAKMTVAIKGVGIKECYVTRNIHDEYGDCIEYFTGKNSTSRSVGCLNIRYVSEDDPKLHHLHRVKRYWYHYQCDKNIEPAAIYDYVYVRKNDILYVT